MHFCQINKMKNTKLEDDYNFFKNKNKKITIKNRSSNSINNHRISNQNYLKFENNPLSISARTYLIESTSKLSEEEQIFNNSQEYDVKISNIETKKEEKNNQIFTIFPRNRDYSHSSNKSKNSLKNTQLYQAKLSKPIIACFQRTKNLNEIIKPTNIKINWDSVILKKEYSKQPDIVLKYIFGDSYKESESNKEILKDWVNSLNKFTDFQYCTNLNIFKLNQPKSIPTLKIKKVLRKFYNYFINNH